MANLKKKAIDLFISRLIGSPHGKSIVKIFLFGSVLKGEADKESDIDLLIVSFDGKDTIKEACLELSFEISHEIGEFIETHIYDLYEYLLPQDYFLYNVVKKGKEVYTVKEERIKEEEIEGFYELAEEYTKGAESLLKAGFYRGAIDQAYNAMELVLKAFLLKKMDDIPGRHSAVVDKFIEYYLRPEVFPKEWSKRIKRAFKKRNDARYRPSAEIKEEDAEEVLTLTQQIMDR